MGERREKSARTGFEGLTDEDLEQAKARLKEVKATMDPADYLEVDEIEGAIASINWELGSRQAIEEGGQIESPGVSVV
jgi:hypothetical protein